MKKWLKIVTIVCMLSCTTQSFPMARLFGNIKGFCSNAWSSAQQFVRNKVMPCLGINSAHTAPAMHTPAHKTSATMFLKQRLNKFATTSALSLAALTLCKHKIHGGTKAPEKNDEQQIKTTIEQAPAPKENSSIAAATTPQEDNNAVSFDIDMDLTPHDKEGVRCMEALVKHQQYLPRCIRSYSETLAKRERSFPGFFTQWASERLDCAERLEQFREDAGIPHDSLGSITTLCSELQNVRTQWDNLSLTAQKINQEPPVYKVQTQGKFRIDPSHNQPTPKAIRSLASLQMLWPFMPSMTIKALQAKATINNFNATLPNSPSPDEERPAAIAPQNLSGD